MDQRRIPVSGQQEGLPLRTAMHRASCVSLPLRSAKRPLQANSANQRIPCACHHFAAPRSSTHIHAPDF